MYGDDRVQAGAVGGDNVVGIDLPEGGHRLPTISSGAGARWKPATTAWTLAMRLAFWACRAELGVAARDASWPVGGRGNARRGPKCLLVVLLTPNVRGGASQRTGLSELAIIWAAIFLPMS